MDKYSDDELAEILWDYNNLHQTVEKADVIIVLGSHDTRVAKRGAQLFLQGYAPIILFSGGFGRLTDGNWTKPEAEVFAEEAIKMGVPKDKILIENKSANTGENLQFSMQLLEKNGIHPKSVILVHKPYMERRQYATWLKWFPSIKAYITSPQIFYEEYPTATISKEDSIHIVVGDTQRIKEYPEKGFQVEQEIPEKVWEAYEELVKRGYTNHLIK